ncbi:hypothetical protein GCM10009799_52460 [Nocardiopsis rhodophaea]|uniref:Uncharacterized protein n=1 Tax=Nocardiopsis rhodophaea TaxID=280238 RepID=A0ABP5F9G1_9ACTN
MSGLAGLKNELPHPVLEEGVRARCWVSEDATAGCVPGCHPDEDPGGLLILDPSVFWRGSGGSFRVLWLGVWLVF